MALEAGGRLPTSPRSGCRSHMVPFRAAGQVGLIEPVQIVQLVVYARYGLIARLGRAGTGQPAQVVMCIILRLHHRRPLVRIH
jgi:hypothetical protein